MDSLTLYRRHTKTCLKKYPQNFRVHFPGTKEAKSKDCQCPIAVEGVLSCEGYITNRSTKQMEWAAAQEIARQWEEWRSTKPPVGAQIENPSVQYAVESFLASQGPQGRNVEQGTYGSFRVLLESRLLPYSRVMGYSLIREFDNLDVVTKFTESWVNLQPTRNRRGLLDVAQPVPLKDSTKKAELERLRSFLKYCVARKWLSVNQGGELKIRAKTEEKFGLEPEEEERLFAAIANFDRGGYNSLELRAFCLVMRHAGLRISDATTLNDTQLVERASGNGWALKVSQTKTKEWVYVPIPDFVEASLRKLKFKGTREGRRYWFWSCEGEPDTAKNNWYTKVMKPIKAAQQSEVFRHHASPHTFRHTFSIAHLNAGTDIKFVSRWLGHKSVAVTEKHYAHATLGTRLASEDVYNASLKRQEDMATARRKRAMELVIGGGGKPGQ
jgi:integrase